MSIQRITEEEVRAHWVQRLSDTPNRTGRFGTAGLTAAEMKAAYDALPLLIVRRYNALVAAIEDGALSEWIRSDEGRTLAEFLRDVTSGELATYLTVDGKRNLAALAAALDTHSHSGVYAPLGEDGRIPQAYLPLSEETLATAEEERREAEARREEAEASREAIARAMEAALDSLGAAEAEREEKLLRCMAVAEGAKASATHAEVTATVAHRELHNLKTALGGTSHDFYEDSTVAYRKRPPKNVLPYARLTRLGGPEVGRAVVTAVASYGPGLLAYPYPGLQTSTPPAGVTVTDGGDGTLYLNGTATENGSIHLYRPEDGFSLPEEPIYIDSRLAAGAQLFLKIGTAGSVWRTGNYTPSSSDEYFGQYHVYIQITAGARFENTRIFPSISRGATPRTACLYHPPVRLEIPERVLTLSEYGCAGNELDLEEMVYRHRFDALGKPLPVPEELPLPEELAALSYLPVEEDGELVFESSVRKAVASTVLYAVALLS